MLFNLVRKILQKRRKSSKHRTEVKSMSEKTEMNENTNTETHVKMECDNSSVCKQVELASNNSLSPDADKNIEKVFSNELILSKILERVPVKDRINAKTVCSGFLKELSRTKFLKEEFIAFRENFSPEVVERLESLGLLDREKINLTFINVETFVKQPENFWHHHRRKVQKVRFKGCGINFDLLWQVLKNSPQNLLEISTVGCFFDDKSGWTTRHLEHDPLKSLLLSTDPPNPKRGKGKLFFQRTLKEYVYRFIKNSINMFVYCSKGNVNTFVFEFPCDEHFVAFRGWDVQDVTIYNHIQLDANPKTLPGWSSFRSYLKTKDIDQKCDPRWVMVEIKEIEHMAIENTDPPFLAYMKDGVL